jgi:release factor glutamine methyltransferase
VTVTADLGVLTGQLERAGFVAAREDAQDLIARAAGDQALLDAMVERRLQGEPLAWITGSVVFCGIDIGITSGVYVPRWQTESLARRAAQHLPATGIAVDVCTGSGAVARVLATVRPQARVVATDIDPVAVSCAANNGVEVYHGDLFAPVPNDLRGQVDVVVGVVPYVPTAALGLLPSDTFRFEGALAYDGGEDGLAVLRRVAMDSTRFLRHGGRLLLELGGDEGDGLAGPLYMFGFTDIVVLTDEEDDVRGVEGVFRGAA